MSGVNESPPEQSWQSAPQGLRNQGSQASHRHPRAVVRDADVKIALEKKRRPDPSSLHSPQYSLGDLGCVGLGSQKGINFSGVRGLHLVDPTLTEGIGVQKCRICSQLGIHFGDSST